MLRKSEKGRLAPAALGYTEGAIVPTCDRQWGACGRESRWSLVPPALTVPLTLADPPEEGS